MLNPLDDRTVDALLSADIRDGAKTGKRLVSLDALRGLTILGMLIVNNMVLGKLTPTQLRHAGWGEGITIADLVFPWFLLIVGLAVPFSAAHYRERNLPSWRFSLRILFRCVVLVLLGCLIDSSLAGKPVFQLGVLQIIGLAYAMAALLHGAPLERRLIIATAFLVAHWAVLRYVPAPGAEVGVLTPESNPIRHLNEVYLQPLHLWGLTSVIPTSALVIIGSVLGDVLRADRMSPIRKAEVLLVSGIALVAAGWLWSFDLAFSKALWTAPYVLFTGGWATLALGLLYLITDVKGWRAWSYPLVVLGSNAIVAYVVPILVEGPHPEGVDVGSRRGADDPR